MSVIGNALGGATKMIYVRPEDKKLLLPAVMALMLCDEHEGVHHFAVIKDGCAIVLSEAGLQCLQAQGVSFEAGEPTGE